MALAHPVDIEPVKRGTTLTFSSAALSTGYEAFVLKVYKLSDAGISTLILTTQNFYAVPQNLTVADVNSAAGYTFDADDGSYYRIDLVEIDLTGTMVDNVIDEFYVFCLPDEISTEESAYNLSTLFNKLLWMLGHNVLDGEFDNDTGYTLSRVRRGYGSLTDAEVTTKLAASDSPGDTDVLFKSKVVVSQDATGQEQYTIEQEQ